MEDQGTSCTSSLIHLDTSFAPWTRTHVPPMRGSCWPAHIPSLQYSSQSSPAQPARPARPLPLPVAALLTSTAAALTTPPITTISNSDTTDLCSHSMDGASESGSDTVFEEQSAAAEGRGFSGSGGRGGQASSSTFRMCADAFADGAESEPKTHSSRTIVTQTAFPRV